jgi:hypothetical protein
MLEITSPITWVNSLLNPLGLTISNRKQVINKLARALFVILAINHVLSTEPVITLNRCMVGCRGRKGCIDVCREMYGPKE